MRAERERRKAALIAGFGLYHRDAWCAAGAALSVVLDQNWIVVAEDVRDPVADRLSRFADRSTSEAASFAEELGALLGSSEAEVALGEEQQANIRRPAQAQIDWVVWRASALGEFGLLVSREWPARAQASLLVGSTTGGGRR